MLFCTLSWPKHPFNPLSWQRSVWFIFSMRLSRRYFFCLLVLQCGRELWLFVGVPAGEALVGRTFSFSPDTPLLTVTVKKKKLLFLLTVICAHKYLKPSFHEGAISRKTEFLTRFLNGTVKALKLFTLSVLFQIWKSSCYLIQTHCIGDVTRKTYLHVTQISRLTPSIHMKEEF